MKKSEMFDILMNKVCETCEVHSDLLINGSKLQAIVDARLLLVHYVIGNNEADKIVQELKDFGCRGKNLRQAEKNLKSGNLNMGLTYTNLDRRLTMVVIGRADSAEEFADTLTHEQGHVVAHISQALGLDPYGEEAQYLRGEITRKMFLIAKQFLCEHCRKARGLE